MHRHRHDWDDDEHSFNAHRQHHGGPRHGFRGRGGPHMRWGQRGPAWFGPRGGRGFGGPGWGRGGPFGDDPFGGDGGGRRRQRRGDIKFALLELIAEQPRHGYELIKALEERYAGFYRPSPGSVYPTLQLLEDEGSAVSEPIDGKRVYSITDAGRKLLEEQQQQADRSGGRHRGPGRGDIGPEILGLRSSAMALMATVMEVGRHGTAEQRRAAQEQLDATRREIYRILSQTENDRIM